MIWLLLACAEDGPATGDTASGTPAPVGALVDGPLNPFPSAELVGDDGRLAFPEGLLPKKEGGTDMDVTRLNWRTGFSRVQPAIARLPVAVDAASLPGLDAIGTGGSVRIVDLDTGLEVPCFAELDAYPDAAEDGRQALIVRPMAAMDVGHRVAVVITDAVTSGGAPLSLPQWADAKANDAHYAELEGDLNALGTDGVALAWDFPVGDGTAITRSLAGQVQTPDAYAFTRVVDVDTEPGALPAGVWKKIEGSYTVQSWLAEDTVFELADVPLPVDQGTAEATLYVHVPESVRGAPAGTVPVVVFGHGILAEPGYYLDSDDDTSRVIELSNRMGAIFVGTTWRGLTRTDQDEAIFVANDFGRFPELTDKLAQGVANNLALVKLLDEGALLDAPELAAADGQPLADRSRLYWYGISLGAIEGAVTLAQQTRIEHAVLHVGGSAWSTMLERSSNWPTFEYLVVQGIPDPYDRQVLYATSQLLWDGVDPASYVDDLRGRGFLWQESIGDEQVPNLTTELLMRSVGVPLATPSATAPYGLDAVALPTTAPAMVQFDPELGLPPAENRPAQESGAHTGPRTWEGALQQTAGFFAAGAEGRVEHFCGSGPCSASSPGQ